MTKPTKADLNALFLIPNNHRDVETTYVKIDPVTLEIVIDGPVRITDTIVHPYDSTKTVVDYTYTLTPDEWQHWRAKPSEDGSFTYHRGAYYRIFVDLDPLLETRGDSRAAGASEWLTYEPAVGNPSIDVSIVPTVPMMMDKLGSYEYPTAAAAVPITRNMWVPIKGVTSLWMFRAPNKRHTSAMGFAILDNEDGLHGAPRRRWIRARGDESADFIRFERDAFGTTVPVDSEGRMRVQFADAFVEESFGLSIVGVTGEPRSFTIH